MDENGNEDYKIIESYLLVKAARYLGVTPWKLAKKSSFWKNLALSCAFAEDQYQNYKKSQNPFG